MDEKYYFIHKIFYISINKKLLDFLKNFENELYTRFVDHYTYIL